MRSIAWVALAAGILLLGCRPATQAAAPVPGAAVPPPNGPSCDAKPVMVILMRHAEKASEDADTELSDKGRERARRIANLLANTGATRLFATEVKRTQQTLAPLAERTQQKVLVRPAREIATLGGELAAMPPGTVAVVAHHSNGVPGLAKALGVSISGVSDGAMAHEAFGRVFVIAPSCVAAARAPSCPRRVAGASLGTWVPQGGDFYWGEAVGALGTVMSPRCRASSAGSRRARVVTQSLGQSSRWRSRCQ